MHKPTKEHNYIKPVLVFMESHPELKGKVSEIDVMHDRWCDIYKNRFCNCNPEITLCQCQR